MLIDLNYFIVFNIYRFIVLIHTGNQRTALHVGYRVIPIHSGDSYLYISPPLQTAWISVPNIEHCTDNCINRPVYPCKAQSVVKRNVISSFLHLSVNFKANSNFTCWLINYCQNLWQKVNIIRTDTVSKSNIFIRGI